MGLRAGEISSNHKDPLLQNRDGGQLPTASSFSSIEKRTSTNSRIGGGGGGGGGGRTWEYKGFSLITQDQHLQKATCEHLPCIALISKDNMAGSSPRIMPLASILHSIHPVPSLQK